jgi:hypothetical protein
MNDKDKIRMLRLIIGCLIQAHELEDLLICGADLTVDERAKCNRIRGLFLYVDSLLACWDFERDAEKIEKTLYELLYQTCSKPYGDRTYEAMIEQRIQKENDRTAREEQALIDEVACVRQKLTETVK